MHPAPRTNAPHAGGAPPSTPPGAPRTRLAPSPTGALHLGNARTFLINWALARRLGWRIVLRIEDLDTPRVKPGVLDATVRTLEALGVDWDEGPIVQSGDLDRHAAAMDRLARAGHAYACELTRGQIEQAASAPQEGAHDVAFPPELRPAFGPGPFADRGTNWRFATPEGAVAFVDRVAGAQSHEPARTVGDFVVWTKRGQPSYQLAVTVDDAAQGITRIVRGDDLLDSTARQSLLRGALGIASDPEHWHLPLVLGPDGRRLAKRHGDSRVERYLARGVSAERIIGLVAAWSGVGSAGREGPRRSMSAAEFAAAFEVDRLPREPVVCTPEDEAWLLAR
jgi:glutamyl-tRNA synthetase